MDSLKRCTRGFSLVELIVVLVVLSTLAAIAFPAVRQWIPGYRLKSATQDMYANFQRAKLMAVQRNQNTVVAFGENINGTVYDYSVFVDSNSNCEYDVGEEVILSQDLIMYKDVNFDATQGGGDGLTFTSNDNGSPAIAFQPNGIPTSNGGGFATGTVFLVNTLGRESSVTVNVAGSVSIN